MVAKVLLGLPKSKDPILVTRYGSGPSFKIGLFCVLHNFPSKNSIFAVRGLCKN